MRSRTLRTYDINCRSKIQLILAYHGCGMGVFWAWLSFVPEVLQKKLAPMITAYIHNEFKSSHDVSNVSCVSFSNFFLTVSSHPSTQLRTATAVDKYQ